MSFIRKWGESPREKVTIKRNRKPSHKWEWREKVTIKRNRKPSHKWEWREKSRLREIKNLLIGGKGKRKVTIKRNQEGDSKGKVTIKTN